LAAHLVIRADVDDPARRPVAKGRADQQVYTEGPPHAPPCRRRGGRLDPVEAA